PPDRAVGNVRFSLGGNNGYRIAKKEITLKVLFKNHAPVIQHENLFFEISERSRLEVKLHSKKYVTDEDSEPLYFQLKNLDTAPKWLSLSKAGVLTALPKYPQVGTQRIPSQVRDAEGMVEGVITVVV